jgi:hypothetical protein
MNECMFIDHSIDPYMGRSPIGCRARPNSSNEFSFYLFVIQSKALLVIQESMYRIILLECNN